MAHHGLIVIGSGPAGVTAARSYLDAGGAGSVTIFSSDPDRPYQRPPLSKEMLSEASRTPGVVPILEDPRGLDGIAVLLDRTVVAVDPLRHTVQVGGAEHTYDRLVLAPGTHPTPLPVADDGAQVHYLRTLADARALHEAAAHARTALVIGSGFVGCEAAASLAARGIATCIITPEEGPPQRDRLGDHAAEAITAWLVELGVEVVTGTAVTSIEAPHSVHTGDGRTHDPDLLVAAIGVTPSTDFLFGSGLSMYNGRIVVDDRMRCSMRDVWAAGDAALAHHARAERQLSVEHWADTPWRWVGLPVRGPRARTPGGRIPRDSGARSVGTSSSGRPGATVTTT